jgi:hypothetical protein
MSEQITGQIALDGTEILDEKAEVTIEEIVETLVEKGQIYKPYGIHTLINRALEVLGADRQIAPQMIYNYSRNSLIVRGRGEKVNGKVVNKDHVYDSEQVTKFMIRYLSKNS